MGIRSGKITRIEQQKNNKSRFSIYLDDQFAFGVEKETLIKFSLQIGEQLDVKLIHKITDEEELQRGLIRSYRMLSRRAHSEFEVRDKLAKLEFPPNTIDAIISRLIDQRYLDDHEFARQFCDFRLRKKAMGKRMLRMDLAKKGLKRDVIELAISGAYKTTSEFDFAEHALEHRRTHFAKFDEKEAKLKKRAFLQSRGFSWDVISEVVE